VPPGVGAYTESFSSGGVSYQGCIMSSKGEPPVAEGVTTCAGDPDSGKRFKLRAVRMNAPMDIVFNAADGGTRLYNVYGKLTNETGRSATGFRVEIGTGIGDDFVPSTGTDGLSLLPLENQPDQLGKYPGGLFGGSPAEGLPFFDTQSASFAFSQSDDSLATSGMPTPYAQKFGNWLDGGAVQQAWFFDNDGRPWTDDKLLALRDGLGWYTYAKNWTDTTIEIDGYVADLTTLPSDPTSTPFPDLDALRAELNTLWGTTYNTQAIVNALLEILTLEREEVTPGYSGWFGDGDPGLWEANPVTVRYSVADGIENPTAEDAESWLLVATWHPELGDEGLYVVEAAFVDMDNHPDIHAIAEDDGQGGYIATAEDMATVVKNNTSDQTDYFGIPGYSLGVIEDLANVNMYYAIQADQAAAGEFTMRITMTDAVAPRSKSSTSGCSVGGGQSGFDPLLPGLALLGLGYLGLRRRMTRRVR
jgi:MYXO-CTERM domain-containing protein